MKRFLLVVLVVLVVGTTMFLSGCGGERDEEVYQMDRDFVHRVFNP